MLEGACGWSTFPPPSVAACMKHTTESGVREETHTKKETTSQYI